MESHGEQECQWLLVHKNEKRASLYPSLQYFNTEDYCPDKNMDFINHESVESPQPTIFEQDQLISFLAGPPNQLTFMFS